MWMFRWLQRLLAVRRDSRKHHDPRWVEPSNAITRAILTGLVSDLPFAEQERAPLTVEQTAAVAPEPAEVAAEERPSAQPATRTAQRSRRRRAGRAA